MCVTALKKKGGWVGLSWGEPRMRLQDGLKEFPNFAGYLYHAEPSSAERGAVTVTRRLDQVYRGNITLIGDASGSVDAITGEGLCLSFHQAIALADALGRGNLESYQRAHRRLARRPNTMGRLFLLLDRYSSLRKRALRCLGPGPELFPRLLPVHLAKPPPQFLHPTSPR